ncbi:hypothetical protein BJ138DRAFT_1113746 [Hygrophoropsis aurantiaca]|uniref:Uncharacterized protein n=1 Tax=Hygrophoropsis aurantiaca TaxID=72124 RepID=A0ACB8ADJ9_9AGAM|nr:hypothetical protein BJ138DRAFT_1113746 [Hygrophoropsis aurantiaca]
MENELSGLEKQESDLFTRLSLLRESIICKRVQLGNLKNSIVPINRLPNEILLACFGQAVRDWVREKDESDERVARDHSWSGGCGDFEWPCTPGLAISHVSHHWRQLAIHMPALWTNLVITPKIKHHMDIFHEILHRVNDRPITANFYSIGSNGMRRTTSFSLMEAIMPMIRTQNISTISFLSSNYTLLFLQSQIAEQPTHTTDPPASNVFSSLTSLTIFNIDAQWNLQFSSLRFLLSTTPELESLTFQQYGPVDVGEQANRTVIDLPKLKHLKIIVYTPLACKLLDSLSAPDIRQLELLRWRGRGAASYLFYENSDDVDLRVPKFPKVWDFTLSWYDRYDCLDPELLSAFPAITHFTMRSPIHIYENEEAIPVSPPTFQRLQHLTLDFSFCCADRDPRGSFSWLPVPSDQADPLLISVFDASDLSTQEAKDCADGCLFWYYKELHQYGKLDKSSSRLDNFLRLQVNGEPAL